MSETKYSAPHMLLHWAIAVLVGVQIILADAMGTAFDEKLENINPGFSWTSGSIFHAILGTAIGLLMIWRLGLRMTTEIPPPPQDSAGLIQTISRATHWVFYAILIGMPIAGALAWFVPSESMATIHGFAGVVLPGLIALHIAGSLYHHIIAGDKTVLRRMLPR